MICIYDLIKNKFISFVHDNNNARVCICIILYSVRSSETCISWERSISIDTGF